MRPGRLLPLLAVALVTAAAVAASGPDDELRPESAVSCWDCHKVAQGESGPLGTFVTLVPGDGAGAAVGEAFEFPVQAVNAWSAELRSTRITLDLSRAPSLGFATDVPALDLELPDAIAIDLATVTAPQRKAVTVDIPVGETFLRVVLEPLGGATGSDLQLIVDPPGGDPFVVDNPGQGAPDEFVVEGRAALSAHGYGNWTFTAQAVLVPDDVGSLVVPDTDLAIPFTLHVEASAAASDDRIASLLSTKLVTKGTSTGLAFHLVALAEPGADESVGLAVDVWAHYKHQGNDEREVDDANLTKLHAVPVPVKFEGGTVTLRAVPDTSAPGVLVQNGATLATVSEAVGYATAFLLVASVWTGGMFGKASRRNLNVVFGTAKRRVSFHNFLSYGILAAAGVHTVLFLVEAAYRWTIGLLWGGLAVLALLGLGVTGAVQVPLIRRWGFDAWRWTHYGLAVAVLVLTVAHILLDGVHFGDLQQALGWRDPLDRAIHPAA